MDEVTGDAVDIQTCVTPRSLNDGDLDPGLLGRGGRPGEVAPFGNEPPGIAPLGIAIHPDLDHAEPLGRLLCHGRKGHTELARASIGESGKALSGAFESVANR